MTICCASSTSGRPSLTVSAACICLNISSLDLEAARRLCALTEERMGLPCTDPIALEVETIVEEFFVPHLPRAARQLRAEASVSDRAWGQDRRRGSQGLDQRWRRSRAGRGGVLCPLRRNCRQSARCDCRSARAGRARLRAGRSPESRPPLVRIAMRSIVHCGIWSPGSPAAPSPT